MCKKRLLIIGCGGHSKVTAEIAEMSGYENIEFFETNHSSKESFLGRKVHKNIENWQDDFFVAIGDNFLRQEVFNHFCDNNKFSKPISLFHPSCSISKYAEILPGALFLPFSVVNSSVKIESGVIVNTSSIVEHDSLLKEFCSLAPGVKTGGRVIVGCRTAISLGCSIAPNVKIGNDNLIGAQSFVKKDTLDNATYFGIPAKFIRKRQKGEKYL